MKHYIPRTETKCPDCHGQLKPSKLHNNIYVCTKCNELWPEDIIYERIRKIEVMNQQEAERI